MYIEPWQFLVAFVLMSWGVQLLNRQLRDRDRYRRAEVTRRKRAAAAEQVRQRRSDPARRER